MSKILDILNSPWAIEPAKLAELVEIYATHVRGEKIDIAAVEDRFGRPLQNEAQGYTVNQGVAVIPVEGVIAKKMNLFTRISGGASTELIGRDFKAALSDPAVHGIVLQIDSPGGSVEGVQELAALVHNARNQGKRIAALADSKMASAAYWIGAAAGEIYMSGSTTIVGDIGVVMQHVDVSRAQEKANLKTTEIYAGKYKRIASEYAPLSEEGRAYLQSKVDHMYSVFVEDVAQFRGVSTDTVLADMADGRAFIGQQALDAGLADGVATLDQLITHLNAGSKPRAPRIRNKGNKASAAAAGAAAAADAELPDAGAASATPPIHINEDSMDTKFIEANHPAIAEAFRAEGYTRGLAEGSAKGATAERERIQAVEAQAMPGHDDLIAALKFDGKTTGPEAAVQVLAAEKQKGAGRLAQIQKDAKAIAGVPAASSASGEQPREAQPEADARLPLDERAKAAWDKDANLRAEFDGEFAAYLAYAKADDAGRVKRLGQKAA